LDPGSEIRDPGSGMGKNPDPGSGINIPDPQHCKNLCIFHHVPVPVQFGQGSDSEIHDFQLKDPDP